MRNALTTVLFLLPVYAAMNAQGAACAEDCVLGPVSVPGLSGPPVWFPPAGGGSFRVELHDPRWSGTPLRRLDVLPLSGSGTGEEAQVRALVFGGKLYFSYQVRLGADTLPTLADAVYLAFNEGAEKKGGYVVEIAPVAGAAGSAPPDPDGPGGIEVPRDAALPAHVNDAAIRWWHTSDAQSVTTPDWGAPQSGAPTWLQTAAVWKNSPGVAWAITFVVDLAGLNIIGALKTFWGTKIEDAGFNIIVGNVTPKTNTDPDRVADTIVPIRSTQWGGVYAPGTCPNGIMLSASDIGVWTGPPGQPSGGTLTTNICGGGACGSGVNTFRVTARRVTNPIFGWIIRARVRIADWGATIASREFAPWKDLPGSAPNGTNIFTGDPSLFTQANGWFWGPPSDNGDGTSDVIMDYRCAIQGGDGYCPKIGDTAATHQCILVELGQRTTGPTAQHFRTLAAFRNMDFADLSTVTRPATVSIAGLQKVTGVAADRDVYLHVETARLPPHGARPLWLPVKDMRLARQLSEDPPQIPMRIVAQPQIRTLAPARGTVPPAVGTVSAVAAIPMAPSLEPAALRAASLPGRLAVSTQRLAETVPVSSVLALSGAQLLDAVWPLFRVRAYFDTGSTLTSKGATRKVLEPLVPFGLYLDHDGPLYGFTRSLVGLNGAKLQPVPNAIGWYRVRIPNEGSVQVAASIAAEEERKVPGPIRPPSPICRTKCCEQNADGTCGLCVPLRAHCLELPLRESR